MDDDDIPINADRWLFVEDLMNFVFRYHPEFPVNPIGEECREFVREGFSEIVKSAVAIIEKTLTQEVEDIFSDMSSKADVREEYKAYAANLRKGFRSSGFDGNKFLHYCVHMACLGERFYRSGLEDFHYLAFSSVRDVLRKYDMSNGGWDVLDLVADKITGVEEHSGNLPSPEYEAPSHEEHMLNADIEPKHINRTWNLLHEHTKPLSEGSGSGSSFVVTDEFLDCEGSIQGLDRDECLEISEESDTVVETDTGSTSSSDSSSGYTKPPSKVPTQSNTISSSTAFLDLPSATDNSLPVHGAYREKYAPVPDSQYSFNHFLGEDSLKALDYSKHTDQNGSSSAFQVSESSSEILNPRNANEKWKDDENSRSASKTVLLLLQEHPVAIRNLLETNKTYQDLVHCQNSDAPLKLCSETKRHCKHPDDTYVSNSTEYSGTTPSVFRTSDCNGFISKCKPEISGINMEDSESKQTSANNSRSSKGEIALDSPTKNTKDF